MKRVLETIDALSGEYLELWKRLCTAESPTAEKARVDAAGRVLLELAEQRGWEIRRLPLSDAGDPFSVTINSSAPEAPVVFSGHIDTVFPAGLFGDPAVREEDGLLFGPGVTDCKGGVAAGFLALDALHRCGFARRPVKVIVQTDEETGSRTSGGKTLDFMLEEAKNAAAFLNTEGAEGNTAVLQRKGILRCRFTVEGRAAHSSRCFEGANAVAEAAHKILKLETKKDPQGLTCNCGVIQGGTVANSVAALCSFTADLRYSDAAQYEEAERFVRAVAEETHIPGCSCRLERISHRPAMPLTEKNTALLETLNGIYERCGLPRLAARSAPGGSDAAYTTLAGIPTVDNTGVEGGSIHSAAEYARVASLAESAKRLAAAAFCL